jgi:hypothetical protein
VEEAAASEEKVGEPIVSAEEEVAEEIEDAEA